MWKRLRSPNTDAQTICNATSAFIAHLVNQYVAHELVALQILLLCLERPTDDSIEVAVGFMREVGLFLSENSPKANNTVYERFRAVLHEGAISKRCQYMIEVLFQVRKDKYKDNVIIPDGLDLVEEEEQITHRVTLDDELKVQEGLSESQWLVLGASKRYGMMKLTRRPFQGGPELFAKRGPVQRDQARDPGRL
jgi:pre-mRNA-splicing factor CWC22